MILYMIIGIGSLLLIASILLLSSNPKNIRNGLFGKKIRILLRNSKTQKYIQSLDDEICLFYCGVVKRESDFKNGINIRVPRNRVSSIIILQANGTMKVEKINSGIESEKVIEINIKDTASSEQKK